MEKTRAHIRADAHTFDCSEGRPSLRTEEQTQGRTDSVHPVGSKNQQCELPGL